MGYLDDDRVILQRGSVDKTGARRYNRKANVPVNFVVELQEDLFQLGFGGGSADGCFGSRTEDAVRTFQEAALSDKRIKGGGLITVLPSYLGQVHRQSGSKPRGANPVVYSESLWPRSFAPLTAAVRVALRGANGELSDSHGLARAATQCDANIRSEIPPCNRDSRPLVGFSAKLAWLKIQVGVPLSSLLAPLEALP